MRSAKGSARGPPGGLPGGQPGRPRSRQSWAVTLDIWARRSRCLDGDDVYLKEVEALELQLKKAGVATWES